MRKNQKGFGAVEGLLILIIVGLIGFAGWYVWKSSANTNNSLSNADAANSSTLPTPAAIKDYQDCLASKTSTLDTKTFPQTCTTKAGKKFIDPDPYAKWKTYVSKSGKFTLKHPANWSADVCEPTATDLVLYLGPTKASSVICGSEHPSQIIIISTPAVPTESEQTLPDSYGEKTSKKVKVDGITGTRQSGKLTFAEEGPTFLRSGTIGVRYFFLTPGRSYILAYVQTPSGDYIADNLAIFDRMVQNTMTFTE